MTKLGVNIDHVATIRQARRTIYPDVVEAARAAEQGGADGITVHLREDRRHIQDADVEHLAAIVTTKLNLEMAATEEMIGIACRIRPADVCIVPEKREELTTEGGLDIAASAAKLREAVRRLKDAGIRVSLFVDPDDAQMEASAATGAPVVEIHTGGYAGATDSETRERERARIEGAMQRAAGFGLIINAGHGLTLENVAPIAALPEVEELNIGHGIVARAIFVGLEQATAEMKERIGMARTPSGRAGTC